MKKKKERVNYRPHKRFGATLIPLVSLTILVAIFSVVVAGGWQLLDKTEYIPPAPSAEAAPPAEPASKSQSSKGESKGEPTGKAVPTAPESKPEPEQKPEAPEDAAYEVPKSEWAGTDYFDDALFVGDSITDGIKIYDIMSNATILSHTGINLDNIFTKPVIKAGEGEDKITIMDAAKAEKPGKIYVMMGANSMGYDKETFIKAYGRLVDELVKTHPDAVIYVQSILPVTTTYEKNRPEFANSIIDDYNLGLRQMAQEKGLPFVNVAAAFQDENGALPTEASPKDGMHFSAQWYRKWFDYLREHTFIKG